MKESERKRHCAMSIAQMKTAAIAITVSAVLELYNAMRCISVLLHMSVDWYAFICLFHLQNVDETHQCRIEIEREM